MITIATISGSAQQNNNTEKALPLVHDEAKSIEGVNIVEVLPRRMKLAIPGSDMDGSDRPQLGRILRDADGIILATPEYHGSFSSMMKLTIENMGFPSILKGKPIGLLGVAGGSIGAVKSIEHLRSVCSHVGGLVLPGSVSISNVRDVFDDDGNCLDFALAKSIRMVATRMVKYIVDTSCPDRSLEEMIRTGNGA